MPLLLKAKLGDLIELIDTKTDDVIRIEIDSTGKNVTRLCFDAPKHLRIERVKLKDRAESAPQHGVPLIGVDMADPNSASITTHAVLPALPDAPESESPRDE